MIEKVTIRQQFGACPDPKNRDSYHEVSTERHEPAQHEARAESPQKSDDGASYRHGIAREVLIEQEERRATCSNPKHLDDREHKQAKTGSRPGRNAKCPLMQRR